MATSGRNMMSLCLLSDFDRLPDGATSQILSLEWLGDESRRYNFGLAGP